MKTGMTGVLSGGLCFLCAAALPGLAGFIANGRVSAQTQDSESLLQGAVDEGLTVVGVSQVGSESDWRIAMTQSLKSAFTAENGFYLIFDDAQQKQENQVKAVRTFILQEVDYIVLDPIVESGWDLVLQEAKDNGIPVIIVDRMVDADPELYTCWVGSDFRQEGIDAAMWLDGWLEEQGRGEEEINIVTLLGTEGSSASIGRSEGFGEVMAAHENWKMLGEEDGDFTQAKGQEAMEKLLEAFPDIDVVVSQNDNMTFGAIDAIHEAGLTCGSEGEITMISFDAVSAAFDSMQAGDINAVFECNPLHGPRIVETIRELEAGKEVDKVQYVDETYFDSSMDLEELKKERMY